MFITRRFDNNFYSSHFPERNLIHIFGMLWKWSIRWSDLWDMTWMVFSRRATPGIRGEGLTPPCEPLWRLLGGANVVYAPRGAVR